MSYLELDSRYDRAALRRLDSRLEDLHDLPYTAEELRQEARERADRLSIQGIQPKLSARLSVANQAFELVDQNGRFILKPPHPEYPALPENEDLTMHLAQLAGLEVPLHGLVYGRDGQLSYFIRRFDRVGRTGKLSVEDFAQLSGASRETKYDSSLEKVATILQQYATFPQVEAVKLLSLVLFSFLAGNEDQHLKNFSLIHDRRIVRLTPAYDLVNSFILLKRPAEMALPLKGKKRGIKRAELLEYYALERLRLTEAVVEKTLQRLAQGLVHWPEWIERSFLPIDRQKAYQTLVDERASRLGLLFFKLDGDQIEQLARIMPRTGQGGQQSFFRQVGRQLHEGVLCLTERQLGLASDRALVSGGWQDGYRLLPSLTPVKGHP